MLGRMKKRRTCADDNVVAEVLQSLPMGAVVELAALINDTLEQRVPILSSWSTLQAILIPKHDSVSKWSDLRPITICPTLCKVWDAVLLRKIQNPVLPNLSPWQFALVPGGNSQPYSHYLASRREESLMGQKLFVMKLDIPKAFGKLLHSAIIIMLCSCMTCPRSTYVHAIASSYKNLRSNFKPDSNVTSDLVDTQRGVRQGSPLSPLLFVMVLDLAIIRCCELWRSKGMGIKIGDSLLSILAFAGDILFSVTTPVTWLRWPLTSRMLSPRSVCLPTWGNALGLAMWTRTLLFRRTAL